MARVRSSDTRPELYLRKLLWSRGRRYRVNRKGLPGSPDIWLAASKTAVFVHGCFWHAHPDCPMYRVPKTRVEFWERKFATNRSRDLRNQEELRALGIKVALVWGCQIVRMMRDPEYRDAVLDALDAVVLATFEGGGDGSGLWDLSRALPARRKDGTKRDGKNEANRANRANEGGGVGSEASKGSRATETPDGNDGPSGEE